MYEPYVADPSEPRPRRRLAGLQPALWTLLIALVVVAGTALWLQGYGQEDPALSVPSDNEGP